MEVRELLSQVVLDTSGHASANSTPKRLNPMVVLTPLPHKLGDPSSQVDTSSQVEHPRWCWDEGSLPGGNPPAPSPTAKTPGPSNMPPEDAGCLWEEVNKDLGELLATESSIDAHWWKLVWELGMALCQNESKTTDPSRKPKLSATQPSGKPKPLVPTPYRRPKPFAPWPSGMQRPG